MSECRSCGAPIFFARTVNGKRIPIDRQPRTDGTGNIHMAGNVAHVISEEQRSRFGPLFVSHFYSCPSAGLHRKR